MKKANKYRYLKVLQADYGCGFEDIIAAEISDAEECRVFNENYKIYRKEDPRPYRVVKRRILAGEVFHI